MNQPLLSKQNSSEKETDESENLLPSRETSHSSKIEIEIETSFESIDDSDVIVGQVEEPVTEPDEAPMASAPTCDVIPTADVVVVSDLSSSASNYHFFICSCFFVY